MLRIIYDTGFAYLQLIRDLQDLWDLQNLRNLQDLWDLKIYEISEFLKNRVYGSMTTIKS